MEEKVTRPTHYFGVNLAIVLAGKIAEVQQDFKGKKFIEDVRKNCIDKSLT